MILYALRWETTFVGFSTRCISFEPRDSKLIDAEYREKLLDTINDAVERDVVLTHGTDTILETADYFFHKMASGLVFANRIVLTGAMTPLSNGDCSDGQANLKFSLDQCSDPSSVGTVSVVLSDFDDMGRWGPRAYAYRPGTWEKHYVDDGRYHRIQAKRQYFGS